MSFERVWKAEAMNCRGVCGFLCKESRDPDFENLDLADAGGFSVSNVSPVKVGEVGLLNVNKEMSREGRLDRERPVLRVRPPCPK